MIIKHKDWIICVDNIRRLRRSRNISQIKLANALGVVRATVGLLETYHGTSIELLCKIADFFSVSVKDLFTDKHEKSA